MCVLSIFTVSSFLWRHSSRKSIHQTLEGASERRWVPSRGILQSWSAGVLERSSSAIVHDTNAHSGTYICTYTQRRSSHSLSARVCSPRKFVVFLKRQLPPSFHPFASKKKPLLPDGKRWKKGRRKEGIYVRGKGRGMLLIVAVGSLKRRRGQERKSGYTSVYLSTTWRRRLRGVEIGDPGSRWILWPFHRLSCGIRLVPVHLLLSFLTERIPPAARPIPSGGGGAGFSPFLASVQLPLFILLPPREWKN